MASSIFRHFLILSMLASGAVSQAQSPSGRNHPLPLLTQAVQIRGLTPEEAALAFPVRIVGVVTAYDRSSRVLYVEDSTGGVSVDAHDLQEGFRQGECVEVSGTSGEAGFSPDIIHARVTLRGKGALPKPKLMSLERPSLGSMDCQWIEVRSVVHSAAIENGTLRLELGTDGTSLHVTVLNFSPPIPGRLEDSRVIVRGVERVVTNSRDQLVDTELLASSLDDIRIEKPGPADPFVLPQKKIGRLLTYSPNEVPGHRVLIEGTVVFQETDDGIYVEDDTGYVFAQTEQSLDLSPGDLVQVVGFPAARGSSVILEEALFRRTGSGPPPEPVSITAKQALVGNLDGALVRISAVLLDHPGLSSEKELVLQANGVTFSAALSQGRVEPELRTLVNGSSLEITGICQVNFDKNRTPSSFQILIRSPKDIHVTAAPHWLNFQRLARAAWIMALAVLVSLVWALMLRRKVRDQTAMLMSRLQRISLLEERYRGLFENANDIVFTCDFNGSMTSINRAGELIMGCSRADVLGRKFEEFVAPSSLQAARRMLQVGPDSWEGGMDSIEIISKNGRRVPLEISSRLMTQHGETMGIQGTARDISERKQAEEAVKRERTLLHTLIDNLPDCVFIKDQQSRIMLNNPAHCALLGVSSPKEAVGKTDADFFPAELAATYLADEKEVLSKGREISNQEEPTVDRDGNRRWLLTTKIPYRDTNGNILGIVGINHDITDRKQAEEAIRLSEEKYRRLVANIPDVTWSSDADGRTTYISSNSEKVFGFTPVEMCGGYGYLWQERLHPDDSEKVTNALTSLFKEGKPFDEVYRFRRKDGEWIWIHDRAIRTYEQAGVQYVDGIFTDETERMRTQEALRKSESRFRRLADSNMAGVMIGDVTGKISEANDAYLQLTGYSREDLDAGRIQWDAMTPPEFAETSKSTATKIIDAGIAPQFETQIIRKDGRRIPILVALARLEGLPIQAIGFVIDLTEFWIFRRSKPEGSTSRSRTSTSATMWRRP